MNLTLGLALCLGLLTLIALTRRVELPGRLRWWRVLLPSWRFFEAPDIRFVLLARARAGPDTVEARGSAHGQNEDAGFRELPPARARSVSSLVYAPDANLRLACHDLVETLVNELAEHGPIALDEAERLVSYQLVQHMTAFFLCQRAPTASHYQFKLSALAPEGSVEELLLSPWYALR